MARASAEDMDEARRRNVNANELAMLPAAYDAARLPTRVGIELKVDGIGLLDVNGRLLSLEGSPFLAAEHLAHELAAIREAFGREMVLHGEFFEPEGFEAALSSFRRGESFAGAAVLFDAVTLKAWHGHEQSPALWMRRELLKTAFDAVRPRMVTLSPITEWSAPTAVLVDLALDEAIAGGHEGLVVKDLDSPYSRGRSAYWMKVKPVETVDVPIQAVRQENGRVRSIVVTFEGRPIVVGAAIPDQLRVQPHEFETGRIVEIRHVGKTPGGLLRGTSFVRFRDDKKGARA